MIEHIKKYPVVYINILLAIIGYIILLFNINNPDFAIAISSLMFMVVLFGMIMIAGIVYLIIYNINKHSELSILYHIGIFIVSISLPIISVIISGGKIYG